MNKPLLQQFNSSFRIRHRGRLPHWELDNAIYFMTYRLRDSLPRNVLRDLDSERREIIQRVARGNQALTGEQKWQIDEQFGRRLDEELDRGYGSCVLKAPEIAEMTIGNWLHFDEHRYHMIAWCVMPNHVHFIVRVFVGAMLGRIVHSWKSYSVHEANKILDRSGRLWQREYYDRIVRDQRDLSDKISYVIDNPRNAGLKGWKWVGVGRDRVRELL